MSKIYVIRDQKVMLDRDLAELYGVETKVLKQAVRRNMTRFPEDFMFEMTKEELENWRSQFVTSKEDRQGLRYMPFCFTEQGVTMLSCVLNSERAIHVNIQIIRGKLSRDRGIKRNGAQRNAHLCRESPLLLSFLWLPLLLQMN